MSFEWKLYSLHELGRIVTGKTPKSGNPDFEGNAVPFITPPDFVGNKWIKNPIRAFSKIGAQSVKNCLIREKSVLITCIGSDMGKAALAATKCFTNQQINSIEVDETRFCPEFIYYNLSLRKEEIRAIAGGSAQPILNKTAFGKIDIFAPSLDEQKRISDFLRPFDDRITHLRETNTTLEAIAQALFKSWFVQFDPVHAKQQGRAPEGMDAQTAALFPDSFEDSELGLVPKGWRVQSIYEIARVTYGAPFASKLFKTEPPGKPLVRIRDLKDECPGVFTEEVHPKGYLIQPGDITVGMDGEFRAYLWGGEEAWLNQRVCVFHPINSACTPFVRLSIAPLLAQVEASETATTVIHLGKNDIDRFKIIVPCDMVLDKFKEIAQPLYDTVVANKQKIQTLSSVRDTLLPRLISGQLRLPEAQAAMEAAP